MILVTGATGMIGAHLLYQLLQQHPRVKATFRTEEKKKNTAKIFAYYIETPSDLLARIDWVQADLTDYHDVKHAMEDVRIVYHAAAMVSFARKDAGQMIHNNRLSTANLVNVALEQKIVHFCHLSSVAALGQSPIITDETTDRNKNNTYSAYSCSKYAAEMEVWRAAAEGLTTVIVNPSIVLGAGDWQSSSTAIFSQIDKGLPFYTNGSSGYVDVWDVANIMILLVEQKISNERYVLNAENLNYSEFFTTLAEKMGKKPPRYKIPVWVLHVVQIALIIKTYIAGGEALITRDIVRSATSRAAYSNEKIRNTIPYTFKTVAQSAEEIAGIYLKNK